MERTSTFTSFSHSLLFTFSFSPLPLCTLAPLRLCVFCFLFSVFCFLFSVFCFLFSLTSVSSRFPLQSADRLGQTRLGIDIDPSGCQADVFGRNMEGVGIKGQGGF